jgi:hypothetical protein
LHLIKQLLKPFVGFRYHIFLDNLFVSTKLVKYACAQGIRVIGTCKDNKGVIQKLLDLKKLDKKDVIKWGTTYSMPTESGKVCQIGWKDQAFVLIMSLVLSSD